MMSLTPRAGDPELLTVKSDDQAMGTDDIRQARLDDEEELRIIRACTAGNWEEFSLLFEKYKERVYFLALSIVKNEALALDVAQNTFIKIFKSLKRFKQRSSFSTWIYRITYNQALDQYRKQLRKGEVEFNEALAQNALRSSGKDAFNELAGKEMGGKIMDAVDSLPMKLRTAVVLKYIEGLTYTEICEIVGCARGVLQKRLCRASKKLRAILEKDILEIQN